MTKTESKMDEARALQLDPPRFENGRPMQIAGLRGHFTATTWEGIPAQWLRLASYGKVPEQVGSVHYGLCFNMSDGIDYLSGVEVSPVDGLPGEFVSVNVPAQKYVVFPHRDHVSKLYSTVDTIWRQWFPGSGMRSRRRPPARRTSSNAMEKASTREPAWAMWKCGYRSSLEESKKRSD
jgi:AraC family transcriptional regulator